MKNHSSPRLSTRPWGLFLGLGLMTLGTSVWASDYLGADGVLQHARAGTNTPSVKTPVDDRTILRNELKAFPQTVTHLAPVEAAHRWLEFVDRAGKLQREPIRAEEILAALPPPAAWPELAKAIAARPPAKSGEEIREAGLQFLAATLNADPAAQSRVFTALYAKSKDGGATQMWFSTYLQQFTTAMLAASDDPDAVLKSLHAELASAASQGTRDLQIPNLVAQVGAEKAEAFLREALVTPGVTLQFSEGNETSRLAQKLALELVGQLKVPQWGLVNSLDAVKLYEALDRQFGKTAAGADSNTVSAASQTAIIPGAGQTIDAASLAELSKLASQTDDSGNNRKGQAQIYYFLGLIRDNRAADAVAIARKFTGQNNTYELEQALKEMQRAGFNDALDDFFHQLLIQDPALPFWDSYLITAAHAGRTDRMLALLQASLAKPDLSDAKKSALRQMRFKALLAADHVDEGVQEMRRLIAQDDKTQGSSEFNAGQLGVMLAKIGQLVKRPEWTEEGLAAARKWLTKPAGERSQNQWQPDAVAASLASLLSELGRGPEAEAVLADSLAEATRPADKSAGYIPWQTSRAASVLTDLAVLYHRAGRPEDVLRLLEQSPDWGVGDLSGLLGENSFAQAVSLMWLHTGSSPIPVPYLAADALLAAGRRDEAQKIDDALLDHFPGLDRGYEVLLALQGTNAIPRLDELFARDQFEERPLIWKAHLLRQENRLEEAELVARQAIAIDPSDGEEGRGDRMRVYSELAEIRAARGDQKDADFYHGVVQAIRLSEDADQYYQAGLLKRAIAMYEEGLTHFSDAYCIQSRLAIQMSDLGMNEAAEEHYRRAYELMPDSFGRVESHCFGCERAFDSERAQSIAEKVFTQIAAEHPDKPQVHYLLGYLRAEQGRYAEARTNYLTAVRLDPEYLNAWLKLLEVDAQTIAPHRERDDIVFNVLRLDPLSRHHSGSFESVTDLAGLWNALAAANTHQLVENTNLFALPASRLALEQNKKSAPDRSFMGEDTEEVYTEIYNSRSGQAQSPARAVAQTPFVQMAGQMILINMGGMMD